MIIQNKKNIVNQILGDIEKGGPEMGPLHVAMTELMEALGSKDVSGAESAFKACIASCSAPAGEPTPEE